MPLRTAFCGRCCMMSSNEITQVPEVHFGTHVRIPGDGADMRDLVSTCRVRASLEGGFPDAGTVSGSIIQRPADPRQIR